MFHFENQDEYISWSVAHIVVSCRVAKAHYGFKYHLTFQNAVFFLIALFIPAGDLSSHCFYSVSAYSSFLSAIGYGFMLWNDYPWVIAIFLSPCDFAHFSLHIVFQKSLELIVT